MSSSAKHVVAPELRRGLRNYWYPVYPSDRLGSDKPVGVQRVGDQVVLWRDGQGVAHAFADRCAHRHAPLSAGDIVDGRLQCRYHGLQYDGTGQCRLVPVDLEMDGPQARGLRVASYATEERGGLVWVYIGDVEIFPPPPLWTDPALTDPSFVYIIPETMWDANWLLVHDNTSDPAHLPFLHGHFAARVTESGVSLEPLGPGNPVVTPQMALDTIRDQLVAIESDRGVKITRKAATTDHTETFDETEFVLPCEAKVWVPLPGGGHPVRSIQYELPIDENQTVVYAWIGRRVDSDDDRESTKELLENFVWPAFRNVFMEDSWISKVQGDLNDAWTRENLLTSDVGPIALRKVIMRAYRDQRRRIAQFERSGNGGHAGRSSMTPEREESMRARS